MDSRVYTCLLMCVHSTFFGAKQTLGNLLIASPQGEATDRRQIHPFPKKALSFHVSHVVSFLLSSFSSSVFPSSSASFVFLASVCLSVQVDRKCDAFLGLHETVKRWLVFIPLVAELRDGSMRERHWRELLKLVEKEIEVTDDMPLRTIERLQLWKFQSPVEEIADRVRRTYTWKHQGPVQGKVEEAERKEEEREKGLGLSMALPLRTQEESQQKDDEAHALRSGCGLIYESVW